jgi:hypothetical protein
MVKTSFINGEFVAQIVIETSTNDAGPVGFNSSGNGGVDEFNENVNSPDANEPTIDNKVILLLLTFDIRHVNVQQQFGYNVFVNAPGVPTSDKHASNPKRFMAIFYKFKQSPKRKLCD